MSLFVQNPSVFDPAIQESGGRFGGGGIDAAKADFDPQFNTGANGGENLLVQNNRFLSGGLVPGATLSDSSSLFGSSDILVGHLVLRKSAATR